MTVCVLGLGEAGKIYAAGLLHAGVKVSGYDPFVDAQIEGLAQKDSVSEAVADADIVVSLVGAKVAKTVCLEATRAMREGAIYADFNTASPSLKREMAAVAEDTGVLFVDVAVLAPVPRNGLHTPLIVSGNGASAFGAFLHTLGAPVSTIDEGVAGDAAGRKLLRSVFMKGLAAVLLECMAAAEEAGQKDWLLQQIVAELDGDAEQLVSRLLTGSKVHAARRVHETSDAAQYLAELGVKNDVTRAAKSWLSDLAGNQKGVE